MYIYICVYIYIYIYIHIYIYTHAQLLNLSSALSDEDMSEDEGGVSSACSRRTRKSRAHTQKRAKSDDTSEESETKSLV